LPRSTDMLQIITLGRPFWKRYQVGLAAVMSFVK
jgi:hypothetical protein